MDTTGTYLESISNAELLSRLRGAEEDERGLSEQRQELHVQIDELLARVEDEPYLADELAELERREATISGERLALHHRITELRVARRERLQRLRKPIDEAAPAHA